MTIIVKNKDTLIFDDFEFKCCVGKNGFSNKKIEGDKKTPIGKFALENLYFREDRKTKPETKLKLVKIKKNMGWCNNPNSKLNYNKLINLDLNENGEKLFRKDYKYDFLIPINYNTYKPKIPKGSAIFIHLTKKYTPTLGCIALTKKDFLILLKVINTKTKIKLI